MKKSELLAFRQHPILPITLEVREDTDPDKFLLSLTVCGKGGMDKVVNADSDEQAAEAFWNDLDKRFYEPMVWGVIPDTFTWSARLKRAMAHLVSLAPDWETLDDWGMTTGTFPHKPKCFRADRLDVPTLDDLEQGNVGLLPDEDALYTEEQVLYVKAYHIVQSVLSFDWATADDQTLRRHPSWLSMEPEAELPSLFDQPDPFDPPDQEPDPLMVNEGENVYEVWHSFFNDAHVSEWRLCWQGQWNGMEGQKVWLIRDSSEDCDGTKYDVYTGTIGGIKWYRRLEKPFPWSEASAWEVMQEVAEATALYEEQPQDLIDAAYGRPETIPIKVLMPL